MAARAANRAEMVKWLIRAVEAPDTPQRQRSGGFHALISQSRASAREQGVPFDLEQFRPLVMRVATSLADNRAVPVVEQFSEALRRTDPAAADAFDASLQTNPTLAAALNEVATKRKEAEEKAAQARLGIKTMKFTAADGREVDVAKLKGKVVLIDFWATWCGPCVAELPNVVANYQKYHDKGFEIVGITLENPGFGPKDDDAKKAAKLDAAKKKMLEFTVAKNMPWPQFFDGQWWKNEYSTKFGIYAIPAMFLLDQNGNIASTEARGPKLEAELKRLLKL